MFVQLKMDGLDPQLFEEPTQQDFESVRDYIQDPTYFPNMNHFADFTLFDDLGSLEATISTTKIEKEDSEDGSYQGVSNQVAISSDNHPSSFESFSETSFASSSNVPLQHMHKVLLPKETSTTQVTTSNPSHENTMPCNIDWAGEHNFMVALEMKENQKDKYSWRYNGLLNKLYVSMETLCPFHITVNTSKPPPDGSYIRAMPFFSSPQNSRENVKRCPLHSNTSDPSNIGFPYVEHLVRSDNPAAQYHTDTTSHRHSVIVPYYPPSEGAQSSLYLYKFMCLSSCNGGITRRPLQIIFTLEHSGRVLGRRVIDVRICACPKRDFRLDQKNSQTTFSTKGKTPLHTDANPFPSKKPCIESGDPVPFTLKIQHKEDYELLKKLRDALEFKRYGPSNFRP